MSKHRNLKVYVYEKLNRQSEKFRGRVLVILEEIYDADVDDSIFPLTFQLAVNQAAHEFGGKVFLEATASARGTLDAIQRLLSETETNASAIAASVNHSMQLAASSKPRLSYAAMAWVGVALIFIGFFGGIAWERNQNARAVTMGELHLIDSDGVPDSLWLL